MQSSPVPTSKLSPSIDTGTVSINHVDREAYLAPSPGAPSRSCNTSTFAFFPNPIMTTAKAIVLITGANSGVGFGLASQLLNRGTYHVLVGARSTEKGDAAVSTLRERLHSQSECVEALQVDVTDEGSIENAAAEVDKKHGRVDILVNNAAIVPMDGPFREQCRNRSIRTPLGT